MKRNLLLILALVCLGFSISLLMWGFWPPRRETVTVPLTLPAGMPSLPETRQIELTYSPSIRAGDSQIVELKLTSEGESGNASVYDEFNVIAEARLDLPFSDVRPSDAVSTALVKDGAATFYWEIDPSEAGKLSGTMWLYLRFIPKAGGEEMRQPVSAQLLEIRSRSMLGRTGAEARVAGVIGLIVSCGLGIPWLRTLRIHRTARKM
jgi:hypothetical protein